MIIKTSAEAFSRDLRAEVFKQVTWGATVATISPKLAEATVGNKFTAKKHQNRVIRDFRAEVFKIVT